MHCSLSSLLYRFFREYSSIILKKYNIYRNILNIIADQKFKNCKVINIINRFVNSFFENIRIIAAFCNTIVKKVTDNLLITLLT